jgi:hypothetical protein
VREQSVRRGCIAKSRAETANGKQNVVPRTQVAKIAQQRKERWRSIIKWAQSREVESKEHRSKRDTREKGFRSENTVITELTAGNRGRAGEGVNQRSESAECKDETAERTTEGSMEHKIERREHSANKRKQRILSRLTKVEFEGKEH